MKFIFASLALFVGFTSSLHAAEDSFSKLKLNAEVGLGYSTNPYSLTKFQIADRAVADMFARVRPEIQISAHGRKLQIGLDAYSDMGLMFGLNANPGFLIFQGNAKGTSVYNQGGVVSFFTNGGLTASRNLGELFVGNLTNLTGKGVLGTTYRPGAGKLGITLQGEYLVQGYPGLIYEKTSSVPRSLNNQSYYLSSRLAWQFLPKTAAFADIRYGYFESVDSNDELITLNPLWAGAGVTGRITNKLVTTLSAQYSRIFMKDFAQGLPDTSFPMGAKLTLDWNYDTNATINFALARDMAPTPIFLDQFSNSLKIKWKQSFNGRWILGLDGQVGFLEYGKPYTTFSVTKFRIREDYKNRRDLFTGVALHFSYSFSDWLAAGISADAFWRWTNANVSQILTPAGWVAADDGSQLNDLFTRYEANVFVRLTY
ncbi:MAG: hypothetical protein V4534_07470 [Myxococcota bacterium]